jgi:hypothetical protein
MKIFCVSFYNPQNADGDREGFIRKGAELGVTHFRDFAYVAWEHGGTHDRKYGPFEFERMTDGGYPGTGQWPFWKVTKWNETWWADFRVFLGWLKKYGYTLYEVVGDFCGLKYGGALKRNSPFYSCDEKYFPDDMASEKHKFAGGIWDPGFRFIWEAFWTKLKSEIDASGVPYIIEFMNEGDIKQDGYGPEKADIAYRAFYEWAIDWWVAHGVPRERQVSTSTRLPKEVADYIRPGLVGAHGHSVPGDVQKKLDNGIYWGGVARTLISADGGYGGHGHADFKGRQCCNAAEAKGIAQECVRVGAAGIEFFPFECEGPSTMDNAVKEPGPVFNCNLVDWTVIDAFRQGLGAKEYRFVHICRESGKLMGDYCPEDQDIFTKFEAGQEPTAVCDIHKAPTPEPQPQPQPQPEQSCNEKYIAHRPMKKWQLGRYILCKFGIRK